MRAEAPRRTLGRWGTRQRCHACVGAALTAACTCVDAAPAGRDGYIVGSKQGGSAGTGGNLKCGAGLMHIVDNVLTKNVAGL